VALAERPSAHLARRSAHAHRSPWPARFRVQGGRFGCKGIRPMEHRPWASHRDAQFGYAVGDRQYKTRNGSRSEEAM